MVKRFHPAACVQRICVVPEFLWIIGMNDKQYMEDNSTDLSGQHYQAQLKRTAADLGLPVVATCR